MTHADSLTVLEEMRDRLEPHMLPESKKWRSDDPVDGFCPLVVPTKKWGSLNCFGYSTGRDFSDDGAGEYGFADLYIAGWLDNPIRDRGLAVSCGYREFLERHIDFEAIFPTVSGEARPLPVDRIAEKAFAMSAEDADLFDRIPKRKIAPTKGSGAKRGPKPPPPDEKQNEDRILTRWDAAFARDSKSTYDEFGKTLSPIMSGIRLEALVGRVRKRRKKAAGKVRQ